MVISIVLSDNNAECTVLMGELSKKKHAGNNTSAAVQVSLDTDIVRVHGCRITGCCFLFR